MRKIGRFKYSPDLWHSRLQSSSLLRTTGPAKKNKGSGVENKLLVEMHTFQPRANEPLHLQNGLLIKVWFRRALTNLRFFNFQTGFLAACPYLFKAILGPLGGVTADMLIRYKICTIGTVRKVFYAAGKTTKRKNV